MSFAGEDRAYVESIVADLKRTGHTVFYDEDNAVEMWGRDLTEYFGDLYETRARYAVMFVSAHYARKQWTNLERRHILARALEQQDPYALPVRLDDTRLPGLRNTVGYLEADRYSPTQLADAIRQKLGVPSSSGGHRSTGLVPRNEHEALLLLGERPPAWEYTYFAWRLQEDLRSHDDAYNDLRIGYAVGTDYIRDDALLTHLTAATRRQLGTVQMISRVLSGPGQQDAFGPPGQPGDPALIEHFSRRLTDLYRQLIDWATGLQGSTFDSDDAREAIFAAADFARQPIISYRQFVTDFAREADAFVEHIRLGQPINLTMKLTLEIPDDVSKRFDRALKKFGGRYR